MILETVNLHPVAVAAATAARNWNRWGAYAASRYAVKRGVPLSLLVTARVLANHEAAVMANRITYH